MKIILNNKYSYDTMLFAKKILEKESYGYEGMQFYSLGVIDALFKVGKINRVEKNWLIKIYVDHIETDDGLGTRYAINNRGQIVDYNDDAID